MNVSVRVVYGDNRSDGLPESAEVTWEDAVDVPDGVHIYAVLGLMLEAGKRGPADLSSDMVDIASKSWMPSTLRGHP